MTNKTREQTEQLCDELVTKAGDMLDSAKTYASRIHSGDLRNLAQSIHFGFAAVMAQQERQIQEAALLADAHDSGVV